MNILKNRMLVIAIIAVLAVIGSLMNSQQSTVRAAARGPTVTIDPTQLPLPVQGSLGVAGTVAATQSGNKQRHVKAEPRLRFIGEIVRDCS
jgi:hypothetical protein